MYSNKERQTFRIYVIILFVGAAAVLLWTGYSQIKISGDYENYKNRLSDKENENIRFGYSLSSAMKENEKLADEKTKIEDELLKIRSKSKDLEKEISDLKRKQAEATKIYEGVLKAEYEYSRGEIKESALILIDIKENQLTNEYLKQKYGYLKETVGGEAAKKFYLDGYKKYLNKDYIGAIKELKISLELTQNEYFSDDCYFYIAYSKFYLNDYKKLKKR